MSDPGRPSAPPFRFERLLPLGPGAPPPSQESQPAKALGDGWERRFVADRARADEALEIYRGLGLESMACPGTAEDLPQGCDDCELATGFWVVYTRRVSSSDAVPGPGGMP